MKQYSMMITTDLQQGVIQINAESDEEAYAYTQTAWERGDTDILGTTVLNIAIQAIL